MALVELFYKDGEIGKFANMRPYEVFLVHQDDARDLRTILAESSVDAIQLALSAARMEHGDVVMLTCKVVA